MWECASLQMQVPYFSLDRYPHCSGKHASPAPHLPAALSTCMVRPICTATCSRFTNTEFSLINRSNKDRETTEGYVTHMRCQRSSETDSGPCLQEKLSCGPYSQGTVALFPSEKPGFFLKPFSFKKDLYVSFAKLKLTVAPS